MVYTWLTWDVLVAASIMMPKWNVWLYMDRQLFNHGDEEEVTACSVLTVAWRLLSQTKNKETYMCTHTAGYHHSYSLETKGIPCWNHDTKATNLVPLCFLQKCMMMKCWQQKMKGVLHCMTLSLKEYNNNILKENLWGEVCKVIVSQWSHLAGPEKCWRDKQSCFNINTDRHTDINLL